MRQVQLYINNQRIDLFDDENVSITDSIKNVKDISKVFTTFSKQFTVPASSTNNKIFKHYYNYDIDNGFDARFKQNAHIELNNMTFRKGKIKLDGVKMQNNKPFAYKITFFGETVDLKDILGEDKLSELSQLTQNLPYSSEDILTALQSAPGDYVMPLVTANQRLYYDSDPNAQENNSGNLHYSTTHVQGLVPKQLKYGMKLIKIIEAIENEPRYNGRLQFSDDSFFKDPNKELNKLYMWLHRKKDVVEGDEEAPYSEILFAETQVGLPYFDIGPSNNVILNTFSTGGIFANDFLKLYVSPLGLDPYDLLIYKNGVKYKEWLGRTGQTIFSTATVGFEVGDEFKAYIRTYDAEITFSELDWVFEENYSEVQREFPTEYTYAPTFTFDIADQIPEQKVIDFLSSLFKMFNLVAYVQGDGKINVQPLNDYYTSNIHDITPFVDISSSEIDAALPYKEIFFKYKDTKTKLAAQHVQELSDIEWGGAEYATEDELSGTIYKVEPDFSHVKFERLLDDRDPSVNTNVMYGYFVDDNDNGHLGSPFIFYVDQVTTQYQLSVNLNGQLASIPTGSTINIPSNLEDVLDETSPNIHFNAELNEYDGELAENSLFIRYYAKYIENIFDKKNRLTKLTAYLPTSMLADFGRKIELSDVIKVNDRVYRINSMKVELTSGKTDFELLNTNWSDIIIPIPDQWEELPDPWDEDEGGWDEGAFIELTQSGGILTGTGTAADPYTLLVESYGSGGDIPNWIWSITGQSTTLNVERTTNISNFIVRAYQSTNSTSRGTLIGSSTTSALTFTFDPANGEYLWIQGTTEDGDENTLYANKIKFWES